MAKKKETQISRLGFSATGAWAKSWFSAGKSERLISRALERGILHFDTAGFEANGLAETRLGKALKLTARDNIEISSKVGTRYGMNGKVIKDFSVAAIRADVYDSLKRLQRDHIDILYLHAPTPEQIDGTRNVMSMLKQEGKIGAIGVYGVGEQLNYAVGTKSADIIMGVYNAFDQSHSDVFQTAKAQSIRTVGIAPLGQALYRRGFMVPKSTRDAWYLARAMGSNKSELKHARHVAANALNAIEGHTPASAMLGFALANTSLETVLINTTRLAHLEENVRIAVSPPLDERTLSIIAKLERKQN